MHPVYPTHTQSHYWPIKLNSTLGIQHKLQYLDLTETKRSRIKNIYLWNKNHKRQYGFFFSDANLIVPFMLAVVENQRWKSSEESNLTSTMCLHIILHLSVLWLLLIYWTSFHCCTFWWATCYYWIEHLSFSHVHV